VLVTQLNSQLVGIRGGVRDVILWPSRLVNQVEGAPSVLRDAETNDPWTRYS